MYPKEFYETGLKVVIAHTKRISSDALSPNVKSLNYLNNILACIEANAADVPEAIMRDKDGYVAECTGDNIFCVVDGEILTPMDRNVLKGITREIVIELARKHNLPFFKNDIPLKKLFRASEVFLTGTAAEVVPVTKIGRDISYSDDSPNIHWQIVGNGSPGPITRKLMELFREYIKDSQNSTPIYEQKTL
jgi:branched-chain amino acid aminotransferase